MTEPSGRIERNPPELVERFNRSWPDIRMRRRGRRSALPARTSTGTWPWACSATIVRRAPAGGRSRTAHGGRRRAARAHAGPADAGLRVRAEAGEPRLQPVECRGPCPRCSRCLRLPRIPPSAVPFRCRSSEYETQPTNASRTTPSPTRAWSRPRLPGGAPVPRGPRRTMPSPLHRRRGSAGNSPRTPAPARRAMARTRPAGPAARASRRAS